MKRWLFLGGGEKLVFGTAYLGKKGRFDSFVSDKGSIKEEYRKFLNILN